MDQHEPLMVGLYFPYLPNEPWQIKGSRKILGMAGHLQRLLKANSSTAGCLLRQLWQFMRQLPTMPKQLVLQLLQGSEAHELPKATSRKRQRASLEEKEG
jgi:hypothetical protein